MNIRIIFISALLFSINLSAYAINTHSSNVKDKFKKCYEKAKTNYDLAMCNKNEYKYYNHILNDKYKKLSSLLTRPQRQKLILAQRAWLNFRYLDCDFAGLRAEGGTLQPRIIRLCQVERTKNRIEDIKSYIKEFSDK